MKRYRSISRGFTIVELLIVVVVIAILAAITIVSYNGITQRASASAAQSGAQQAATKAEAYKNTSGDLYPVNKATLGITDTATTYIQYNGGTGYCASTLAGSVSYYVSNFQTIPASGECESAPMANGASTTTACPSGFLPVPGDARFGTKDFCVMKYEAKNDGSSHPQSVAAGTPWVSLSQAAAITYAQSSVDQFGTAISGAHLITEPEWMTIAANVLSVPANWSGGAVGSGYIFRGHSDAVPLNALVADTNDANGYGTGVSGGDTGNTASSGTDQKRTLYLTTGATIWDLAGNVYEWTQFSIATPTLTLTNVGVSGDSGYAWRQWNLIGLSFGNLPATSLPSAISSTVAGYSSTQGIGQLYANYADATNRAPFRGGMWNSSLTSGVLAFDPYSTQSPGIGFRVTR